MQHSTSFIVALSLSFFFLLEQVSAQSEIKDADGNTKVETDRAAANSDVIWLKIGGTDRARFTGSRLEFLNTGGSIFIGEGAGASDDLTENLNLFIGDEAGTATTTGIENVALGRRALFSNTTGQGNMAIGSTTLYNTTTGTQNAGIGKATLFANTSGSRNVGIGFSTLRNATTADDNVAIGSRAGFSTIVGAFNVLIGSQAGFNNENGSENVLVGYQAGRGSALHSKSGSVCIGYKAGFNELGSNRLYIENSGSNLPLIYGEFDNDYVKINGRLATSQGFTDSDNDTKIQLEETADEDIIRFDLMGSEYFVFTKNTGDHARLEIADAANNLFIGKDAGFASGNFAAANLAFGNSALYSNTVGYNNTAIGHNALLSNTSGFGNLAIGFSALGANNLGTQNVAIGIQSLNFNTIGNSNVAIGTNSLYNNTIGTFNIGIGHNVLATNTVGKRNSVIGESAMFSNRVGSWNSVLGAGALYHCDSVDYLVAVGDSALYKNGMGASGGEQAHGNVAIGSKSMYNNTIGSQSTALGYQTLYSNVSGNSNVAIGHKALYNNDLGSFNSGFGFRANELGMDLNNATAVGASTNCTASDQVRIGNSSVTSIGGFANWTNVSDQRFKQNVQENVKGLEFINALRPVTYTLDQSAIDGFFTQHYGEKGNSIFQNNNAASSLVRTGFIAQEVEAAAASVGYDFSGVDAPKNEDDFYGLRYAEFTVPLVKAVQEMSGTVDGTRKAVDELFNENEELKAKIVDLEEKLAENEAQKVDLASIFQKMAMLEEQLITQSSKLETLENAVFLCCEKHEAHLHIQDSDRAYLEQNTPNPFATETRIRYYLPKGTIGATLRVMSEAGRTIRQLPLVGDGLGAVTISTADLAGGTYPYALFIGEKMVEGKMMVVVRD